MTRRLPYATTEQRRSAEEYVRRHLAAGGILAYPTETVYGLGCALIPLALEALAAFKGERPFLLLIRDRSDAAELLWTAEAERLARRFWPGPLTLALSASAGTFPPQVVGSDGAVAVRVSPHPGVADLLSAAAGPLTSTSANFPGEPPARSGDEAAGVASAFPGSLVLDAGELPFQRPSTIVRCAEVVRVIREGAIPTSELRTVVDLQ